MECAYCVATKEEEMTFKECLNAQQMQVTFNEIQQSGINLRKLCCQAKP